MLPLHATLLGSTRPRLAPRHAEEELLAGSVNVEALRSALLKEGLSLEGHGEALEIRALDARRGTCVWASQSQDLPESAHGHGGHGPGDCRGVQRPRGSSEDRRGLGVRAHGVLTKNPRKNDKKAVGRELQGSRVQDSEAVGAAMPWI